MKDKKIDILLSDEDFLRIAKQAHELDITFNHMVERILTKELLELTHDIILDQVNESLAKNKAKQNPSRRPMATKSGSTSRTRKKITR